MRVLALACWMAIGGFAAHAAAQPVDLEWHAERGCPTRQQVLAEIAARLGERAPREPQLSASGAIERTAAGYTLRLETQGGERVLEAPSCEELAQSAAVILALLIEPSATPPTAASGPRVWGAVRAELVVDFGLLPGPSFGPGLAAAAGIRASSLELSGSYLPTQGASAESGDVADLRAFAARLFFCQRIAPRPELGLCGGAEYARLIGRGAARLEQSEEVSTALWSLHLALRLSLALGKPLAFVVEAGAGLPLSVAAFTVQPHGIVHETGAAVGRVRTGLELRF